MANFKSPLDLSGLFADDDQIAVGVSPDGEPFVVMRSDIVILPSGETLMAVALTPEAAAHIAASIVTLAQACCDDGHGKADAKRQEAIRAIFHERVRQLSTLEGAKQAVNAYAKRRPS